MKRWTIRILICVLLGAILNVAVAWGCAVAHRINPDDGVGRLGDVSASEVTRAQAVRIYHRVTRDNGLGVLVIHSFVDATWNIGTFVDSSRTDTKPDSLLEPWAAHPDLAAYKPLDGDIWIEVAAGWPKLTLRSRISDWSLRDQINASRTGAQLNGFKSVKGAWVIRRTKPSAGPIVLPLTPLWSSFIINTLFYASICFAMWFTPGMIRRRIRSARGRCIKCGYDLRGGDESTSGGGCPECGWGRKGVSG